MYRPRLLHYRTVQDILDPDAARSLAMKRMSSAQLKYAMIIFTTAPVLCAYPFFQRYFVKGIMLGSLKQ